MKITITKVADIQKLMNFGHEKKKWKESQQTGRYRWKSKKEGNVVDNKKKKKSKRIAKKMWRK